MKKNIYYQKLYENQGKVNENMGALLTLLMAYPKLILDVFLRKNMGERYFTIYSAVVVLLILFFIPICYENIYGDFPRSISYYLFLVAYAIMAVIRAMEVRREPSVYDFARFSKSRGFNLDFFDKIRIGGEPVSMRVIELYLEPLFAFLIGVLLLLLAQGPVAVLIIFCSVCYFLTNRIAITHGDHFIMDKIDEIIVNEELSEAFTKDMEVSPRQVPFFSKKPSTAELRQTLADHILNYGKDDDDDDGVEMT